MERIAGWEGGRGRESTVAYGMVVVVNVESAGEEEGVIA
jgi:hypothetical protein